MFLTNHTLTGVLLGMTIDHPAVLVPAALASHLALDMTPHFGADPKPVHWERDRPTLLIAGVDFVLSTAAVVAAVVLWPQRAGHILVGAICAGLPDFTYVPLVLFGRERVERLVPGYRQMIAFLLRIQWYEKPPGIVTEAVWASLMLAALNLFR